MSNPWSQSIRAVDVPDYGRVLFSTAGRATAACYLMRQDPGAERFGGATVRIRPSLEEAGTLDIQPTQYRVEAPLRPNDAAYLEQMASEAVAMFAERSGVDVAQWHIEIFDFAYHPVDTRPRTMKLAIGNALTSAFVTWRSMRLELPEQST